MRIISYSSEQFRVRQEAGQLLANELKYLFGKEVVVLGIPRGGIIAAIPVATKESAELLVNYADEVIVLRAPEFLGAISQFYLHFGQTCEEEVLGILKEAVRIKEHLDEKRTN